MEWFLDALGTRIRGPEARLARAAQRAASFPQDPERRRFEHDLVLADGGSQVRLGRLERLDGTWAWVGLPPEEFLGRHWWLSGASGAGKSLAVLSILAQVLTLRSFPIALVDAKGELATLVVDLLLPALAREPGGEELLTDCRVVRPFDERYTPDLRLTAREPRVPIEIQAMGIAASLADAVGVELGHRMEHVFSRCALLAIERDEPLTRIVEWLTDPALAIRTAARSSHPATRTYFMREYPHEPKETIRALGARLGAFEFLPSVRAALEAPRCLDFGACLDRGLTIFDVGNPPGGVERASQFLGSVIVGRLARAILSRPVASGTPHTLVGLEEFQEIARAHASVSFSRLCALARHKKISLLFVNQQAGAGQLEPELVRVLRTNTGGEMVFRCARPDAEALAHALPLPSDAKSVAEARLVLVQRMTRLAMREHVLWIKDRPYGAQFVRSPRLDLEALREQAAGASPELLERIRRGTVASPRGRPATEAEAPSARDFPELPSGPDEPPGQFPGLG